ncbi:MAG: methyl-accepting chemotaxis protein [Bacillota bacterium]|nr:methyl-accepting chemotaxis protein [Bacillota bacterium]
MNGSLQTNHARRVTKSILIAFWPLFIFAIISPLLNGNPMTAVTVITNATLFITLSVSTVLFYLKRYETFSGMILCSVMGLNTILISFSGTMTPEYQVLSLFCMLLVVCAVTLFLNKKSFIMFCLLLDVIVIVVKSVTNTISINFSLFITVISIINFCMIILFFVTKWGSELIEASIERERNATVLLEELKNTMDSLKHNTNIMNIDIAECNSNLQSVRESSASIITVVQEVSKGVTEQAGALNHISGLVNDANDKINETVKVSHQLTDVSVQANQVVSQGSKNILDMNMQMNIIHTAVNSSLSTVSELQQSMDKVSAFLEGISQIAEQTNLLSLNASIEAARAGELGKGFAVVAGEVKKLAEQSTEIAASIGEIINDIRNKSEAVQNDVQNGKNATQIGETIVRKVIQSFESIQSSFEDIDGFVVSELNTVENVRNIFKQLREESESIASISEEHSASAEEMSATIEAEDINIKTISELMKNIHDASKKLESLIKN